MAATRKLQVEIDRCLKKVTEGVADFEEIWNKLHSSTGNVSKYQDDLKKEIKKLQRYRDQIRSWLLSDEVKDKSVLVENRKLIETQMERFKLNEREAKKKMFSKEGLVSQNFDPVQKERNDVSNWLTASIDTLNVQFDQFECEVESLALKKKLSSYENNRRSELKTRMERHAFHIKKLETLLRMLDNMSVEVHEIVNLKEDVNYYIEFCEQAGFQEDDLIYEDIAGLNEIEFFGLDVSSPRPTESGCATSTSPKTADVSEQSCPKDLHVGPGESEDGKKPKPASKQKATAVVTPSVSPWPSTSRVSQNLPQQSTAPTCVGVWDAPAEVSPCSTSSSLLPTFASVAANSTRHPCQAAENGDLLLLQSTKKLPALLELCVEPPYCLACAAPSPQEAEGGPPAAEAGSFPGDRPDTPRQDSDRRDLDVGSNSSPEEESAISTSSGSSRNTSPFSLPSPNVSSESLVMGSPPMPPIPPLSPQTIQREYDNYLAVLQANVHRPNPPPTYVSFGEFLPPIPMSVPHYYPQRKEDLWEPSSEEFFDKLCLQVLFFLFYYSPGSEAQLQAARALKKKQWRFHKALHTWFRRTDPATILTDSYERGKFTYFDYSIWELEMATKDEFFFEFKFLENEDLDLLFALNVV